MSFDRHRFEELKTLGTGGFSNVFLVRDRYSGMRVALKVIKSVKLNRKNVVRLQDEFLLLNSLKHQNLVEVYDIGFQPDTHAVYYTMEYCQRTNLLTFLVHKSEDIMVDAVVQILRALNFIHSHDIIHFDIKPENFGIIEHKGGFTIKLLDFGLFLPKNQIRTSSVRGTLQYMAPELFSKEERDHRLDLYSLGMVLLKILLFRNNVKLDSKYIDLSKLTPEQLRSIKEQRMLTIVSKLVKRNPDDRYRNAYQVLEDLNRLYQRSDELVPTEEASRLFFEPRFVGRNNEINYLKVLFVSSNIRTFQTSAVLIKGESGIGKSRLMKELQIYAQLTGYKIREAFCTATGDTFGVARQLFRQLMPEYNPDRLTQYGEEFAKVYRALVYEGKQELSDLPVEQNLDDTVVSGYFYQLVNLFEELLEKDPVAEPVFYIHDLHQVDEMSLQFLKPFFRKSGSVTWFVSLSSDIKLTRYQENFLQELDESDHAETVILRSLDREDVSELLSATFPKGVLTEGFHKFVYEQSGGNPLLISELLKSMIATGDLKVLNGTWRASTEPSENLSLISLLDNVLQFRVLALDTRERPLLTSLALIREPVSYRFMQRLFSNLDQLDSAIAGLVEKRLLDEFNGKYVIPHSRLIQTLVRFIDPDELPDRYLAIARVNEEMQEFRFEDTARFYLMGNDRENALVFYRKAFRSYRNLFRNEKVLDIAETLFQLTEETEEKRQYLEEMIRTCMYAGDTRRAQRFIRMYQEQFIAEFEHTLRYNYFQVDWYNRQGKVRKAREWLLDFFLEHREQLEAGPHLGRLYLSLGQLFVKEGDMDGAELYLNLAAGFIEKEGGDDVIRGTLNQLMAGTMIVRGDLEAVNDHLEQVAACYERASFLPGLSAMHNNRGRAAMKQGKWEEAIDCFDTAVQIQNKVGNYFQLVLSFGYMSRAFRLQGRYQESWTSLERGAKYLDLIRDSWGKIFYHTEKAAFLIDLGELVEAENELMLAEILAAESEFKREQVHIQYENARLLYHKHHLQEGYRLVKSVEEGYRTVGGQDDLIKARCMRARFAIHGRDPARAVQLLQEISRSARQTKDPWLLTRFHRLMGEAMIARDGNGENALFHLNEAVRISHRNGLRMEELLGSTVLLSQIPEKKQGGSFKRRKRRVNILVEAFSSDVPKRYWRQFQLREDIHRVIQNREGSS